MREVPKSTMLEDFASEEDTMMATSMHSARRKKSEKMATTIRTKDGSLQVSVKKKFRGHETQPKMYRKGGQKKMELTSRRRKGKIKKMRGAEASLAGSTAKVACKRDASDADRLPRPARVVSSLSEEWFDSFCQDDTSEDEEDLVLVECAELEDSNEDVVDASVVLGLRDAPSTKAGKKRLLWLDLSRNVFVNELPACVARSSGAALSNLVGLTLSGCSLPEKALEPIGLALRSTLRYLDASNLRLYDIPTSWSSLGALRVLLLSGNTLRAWPAGNATSAFCLAALPFERPRFKPSPLALSLRKLDLSHNQIVELPERVSSLKNLKHLDVSHNRLDDVDDNLFFSAKLNFLDLSHNELFEIGPGIVHFFDDDGEKTSMPALRLSHNAQLVTPPAKLADQPKALRDFYDSLGTADAALQAQRNRAFVASRDVELLRRLASIDARAKALDGVDGPSSAYDDLFMDRQDIARLVLRLKSRVAAPSQPSTRPPNVVTATNHHHKMSSPGGSSSSLTTMTTPTRRHHDASPRSHKSASKSTPTKKSSFHRAQSEPFGLSSGNSVGAWRPHRVNATYRAEQAARDLKDVYDVLNKLARGDEYVEVLACFSSPREDSGHEKRSTERLANLELMREVRALIDVLPLSQRELVPAATWPDDVLAKLKTVKPRIIHFAGHCDSSNLVFTAAAAHDDGDEESSSGGMVTRSPSVDELVHVLQACDGLELCFLNACSSGSLGRDLVDRLPYIRVVCWETIVHDKAASDLARMFYKYIAKHPGCDVEDAFDAAVFSWPQRYKIGNPETAMRKRMTPRVHGVPNLISASTPPNDPYKHIAELARKRTAASKSN